MDRTKCIALAAVALASIALGPLAMPVAGTSDLAPTEPVANTPEPEQRGTCVILYPGRVPPVIIDVAACLKEP